MSHRFAVFATIAVGLLVSPYSSALFAQSTPADISDAVADINRPDADKALDVLRKPQEMLAFAGVKRGDKVVEFVPGGGYVTRLLSKIVGPSGHVYSINFPAFPDRLTEPVNTLAANSAYPNVSVLVQDAGALKVPEAVDVVWVSENYHDFKNPGVLPRGGRNFFAADTSAMNRAIYAALRPGGLYIINDYVATPGSGLAATQTLHRIDPAIIKQEVTGAGFALEAESNALANPADDHVSERSRQGSDQVFLKFRKPR